MSKEQRDALDTLLRAAPLDLGGEVIEQREIFEQMMSEVPLADDVRTSEGDLGGVPVVRIELEGVRSEDVIMFVHGGAYAVGSAAASAGLASDLARSAGARAVAIDYRLAPEHPYPAAIEDALAAYRGLLDGGVAPERIAVAGESAGGGLAVAMLAALKREGLPQPAGAVVMSPWADLTISGANVAEKAPVDPSLAAVGLRRRVQDYARDHDPADGLISPIFADLSGLPPLLIQAGSHEILLDDATRLAARAAVSDVAVTLEVTPGVPHVFQAFAATLDEAREAIARAGAFLRAHFDSALR